MRGQGLILPLQSSIPALRGSSTPSHLSPGVFSLREGEKFTFKKSLKALKLRQGPKSWRQDLPRASARLGLGLIQRSRLSDRGTRGSDGICVPGAPALGVYLAWKKRFEPGSHNRLKARKVSLTRGSDPFDVWVPLGEFLLSPRAPINHSVDKARRQGGFFPCFALSGKQRPLKLSFMSVNRRSVLGLGFFWVNKRMCSLPALQPQVQTRTEENAFPARNARCW